MTIDKLTLPKDDDTRIEAQAKKQIEYTIVGSQQKVNGHTLFQYNLSTGEITIAKIKYCDTVDFLTGKPLENQKVEMEKGCIYRQALNKKNVIKHLRREGYTKFKL